MNKLLNYFSFKGRAKRAKVLQFFPLALIVWFLAGLIDELYIAPNLCEINEDRICYLPGEVRDGVTFDRIIAIILMVPFFSVLVRRLHDHDRSGWWSLLSVPMLAALGCFLYYSDIIITSLHLCVAAIIALPLIYWLLKKGSKEPNQFG